MPPCFAQLSCGWLRCQQPMATRPRSELSEVSNIVVTCPCCGNLKRWIACSVLYVVLRLYCDRAALFPRTGASSRMCVYMEYVFMCLCMCPCSMVSLTNLTSFRISVTSAALCPRNARRTSFRDGARQRVLVLLCLFETMSAGTIPESPDGFLMKTAALRTCVFSQLATPSPEVE